MPAALDAAHAARPIHGRLGPMGGDNGLQHWLVLNPSHGLMKPGRILGHPACCSRGYLDIFASVQRMLVQMLWRGTPGLTYGIF